MNLSHLILTTIANFAEAGRIVTTANGTPLTVEQIAEERAFLIEEGYSFSAAHRARYLKQSRKGRTFALTRRSRSELFDLILTVEDLRCASIAAQNRRIAELSTPEMTRIISACLPA